MSIETAEENNAQQLEIAEINPLRYRGYYYDNETGYYYLQSRYYDPELGRFISADGFSYINSNNPLNINAYAYCANNPIIYSDPNGTAYVSSAGKAVCDLIAIIFVSWDAQERLGDAFACSVAAYYTLNTDELYFDFRPGDTVEANEQRRKVAADKVFANIDKMANEFTALMESGFFKFTEALNALLKLFGENLYVDIFNECIKQKTMEASLKLSRYIQFSFGYGNPDSPLNTIKDLFEGKFTLISSENNELSFGIIQHDSNGGIFVSSQYNMGPGFFGFWEVGMEIDIDDLLSKISNVKIDNNVSTYIGIAACCIICAYCSIKVGKSILALLSAVLA